MQTSFLLYQTEDGQTKIQTRLEDEIVWLSQAQICELFQKHKSTVNEHISNIFNESELDLSEKLNDIPYKRKGFVFPRDALKSIL